MTKRKKRPQRSQNPQRPQHPERPNLRSPKNWQKSVQLRIQGLRERCKEKVLSYVPLRIRRVSIYIEELSELSTAVSVLVLLVLAIYLKRDSIARLPYWSWYLLWCCWYLLVCPAKVVLYLLYESLKFPASYFDRVKVSYNPSYEIPFMVPTC